MYDKIIISPLQLFACLFFNFKKIVFTLATHKAATQRLKTAHLSVPTLVYRINSPFPPFILRHNNTFINLQGERMVLNLSIESKQFVAKLYMTSIKVLKDSMIIKKIKIKFFLLYFRSSTI